MILGAFAEGLGESSCHIIYLPQYCSILLARRDHLQSIDSRIKIGSDLGNSQQIMTLYQDYCSQIPSLPSLPFFLALDFNQYPCWLPIQFTCRNATVIYQPSPKLPEGQASLDAPLTLPVIVVIRVSWLLVVSPVPQLFHFMDDNDANSVTSPSNQSWFTERTTMNFFFFPH